MLLIRPSLALPLFRLSPAVVASALVSFAAPAFAADIYVSPAGGGDGSTEDSPTSLNSANTRVGAGDTVWMAGGVYSTAISPQSSGAADAWITYQALDGALPIIDDAGSGVNFTSAEYIIVDGVASRNNQYMGFTNQYTDMCSEGAVNNGHLKFRNVIAQGNGISGIAFFCATGISIERAIVAHNGLGSSWSSGINIYGSAGGPSENVVRSVVAFENIDISDANSDGNGFIMDIGSDGVLFENCIGFRNGGSCFRVTHSSNAQFVNNTCWNNGQFDSNGYGDEVFFSNEGDQDGAIVRNNILVANSGYDTIGWMTTGFTDENNLKVANGGAAPFFVSTDGVPDFHLVEGAADAVDQAASTGAPETDIGFDPRCLKQGAGTFPQCGSTNGCSDKIGWFQYGIDYDYIEQIGGIRRCFQAGERSGAPDIGAYEQGAVPIEPEPTPVPDPGDSTDGSSTVDSSDGSAGSSTDTSQSSGGASSVPSASSPVPSVPPGEPAVPNPPPSASGAGGVAGTPSSPTTSPGAAPSQPLPGTATPPSGAPPANPGAAGAPQAGASPLTPPGEMSNGASREARGGCHIGRGPRSPALELTLLGLLALALGRRRRPATKYARSAPRTMRIRTREKGERRARGTWGRRGDGTTRAAPRPPREF